MSTQNPNGTSFSILPEESQQHFRLLELPPELLSVLTSNDPPTLQFKSLEGPPGHALDTSNAVICTDARTFSLRQVNTSNSVYIARPNDVLDDSDGPHTSGLQAIAENNFTLELSLVPPHVDNATPHIRAALPVYSSTGHRQTQGLVTKEQLFANIPCSERECNGAFEQMACFEMEEPRGCFIPSGQAKVQAWRAIMEEAALWSLDITGPLSVTQAVNIISQPNDLPRPLMKAVRDVTADKETRKQTTSFYDILTVPFLGTSQLEAMTQTRGVVSVSDFMAAWADLLPEKWRSKPDLELIKGQYVLTNDGRDITMAGTDVEQKDAGKAAPSDKKSTLGAKRKWHEKFRASKKHA